MNWATCTAVGHLHHSIARVGPTMLTIGPTMLTIGPSMLTIEPSMLTYETSRLIAVGTHSRSEHGTVQGLWLGGATSER